MTDKQFDPIEVAAQMGGTTSPTVEEVANFEAFAEPEPDADVTDEEADRAEILEEGELADDVPGPDADGEPVEDSP